MGGTPRAPLRTGGFYGLYDRRGRNELKTIDGGTSSTNNPSAGIVTLLNGVATGTDYTNRVGRKTIMKSILFRLSLVPNASATNGSVGDVLRVMLIYDCQTNGAAPAVSDVLQGGTLNNPMNLTNRDRFKIISDKFLTMGSFVLAASSLTTGSPRPVQLKIYKKMNLEMIFSGTGNTVGSIQTGGLFLLLISLNNQITTSVWDTRIRFIDA